ncbi:MAG: hypothetical protein WCA84_12510 [Ignavibacteriaceae bacterium]
MRFDREGSLNNKTCSAFPKGIYQCCNYYAPEVLAAFGSQINVVSSQNIFLSGVDPVKEIHGNIIWELISTNF